MVLIIKDRRRLFFHKKWNYLLIIKNIFEKITKDKLFFIKDFNIDTALKVIECNDLVT